MHLKIRDRAVREPSSQELVDAKIGQQVTKAAGYPNRHVFLGLNMHFKR